MDGVFPAGYAVDGWHVVCARVWGVPAAGVVRATALDLAAGDEALRMSC